MTAAAAAGAWRSSGASIRAFATAFGPRLGDGLPGCQSKRAVSVPGPGCMGPRLERGTCAPVVASGATGVAGHGSTAGVVGHRWRPVTAGTCGRRAGRVGGSRGRRVCIDVRVCMRMCIRTRTRHAIGMCSHAHAQTDRWACVCACACMCMCRYMGSCAYVFGVGT